MADNVITLPERLGVKKITAHQTVRSRGGFIVIVHHQMHLRGLLLSDAHAALPPIVFVLFGWFTPAAKRYCRKMRIVVAGRNLARDKSRCHLPVGYTLVTHGLWRTCFRRFAPWCVGVYVCPRALDGIWWLDIVS